MKTKSMKTAGRNVAIAAAMMAAGVGSAVAQDAGTTVSFGGYAKFDSMFTDYSAAVPASSSLIRQFYLPSAVPTGNASSDMTADFQGRETRLFFRADTVTEGGDKIGAYAEIDFFTHSDGNELVSNSYSPRLRHAFVKYNGWLFGQTWSTFQDVGALPENLDFVGPAESTTFVRQAQVRYTTGDWEFAAENPETFYSAGGDYRQSDGDDTMPDLVARYTFKLDNGGYIKAAGLFRQLKVDATHDGARLNETETATAISISGKHMFGKDDLRWMVTTGSGVGRYLGLAVGVDAVGKQNLAGDFTGLEAVDETGAFVSYRHFWNEKWRSNFTFGTLSIDNPAEAGAGATESASSVHVNFIYSPQPKLDLGVEFMRADREVESGADGDMTRVMFSAKYAF